MLSAIPSWFQVSKCQSLSRLLENFLHRPRRHSTAQRWFWLMRIGLEGVFVSLSPFPPYLLHDLQTSQPKRFFFTIFFSWEKSETKKKGNFPQHAKTSSVNENSFEVKRYFLCCEKFINNRFVLTAMRTWECVMWREFLSVKILFNFFSVSQIVFPTALKRTYTLSARFKSSSFL